MPGNLSAAQFNPFAMGFAALGRVEGGFFERRANQRERWNQNVIEQHFKDNPTAKANDRIEGLMPIWGAGGALRRSRAMKQQVAYNVIDRQFPGVEHGPTHPNPPDVGGSPTGTPTQGGRSPRGPRGPQKPPPRIILPGDSDFGW